MPHVHVEFFGIARARAGTGSLDLEARTTGDAIAQLAEQFPDLAQSCFQNASSQPEWILRPDWILCVNGRVFTRNMTDRLADGDALLLLSTDAGG